MNTKTLYLWAALGLFSVVPNALVSGDYFTGKEVYDSGDAVVFDASPYNIDLYGGASAVYNSNTTQLLNGTGAWVGVFDFGFELESANQGGRGIDYGLGYDGGAYWWESSAAAAGRDPLEHRVDGYFQVNGGKTRFRFTADYYRNNGNSMDFNNVQRETRTAQSTDFPLNAGLERDLANGSLEFGAGYLLRAFDSNTFLNDQHSYFGDVAWYHRPNFAPKTSLGVGFRFGTDNYQNNADQEFYTTTLRWRYQASGKTTAYGSVGWENRGVAGGQDADNFVFDAGVVWAMSDKTKFDFFASRSVRPSYSGVGQDYENLGFTALLTHDLPGLFVLNASAGFDNSNYFASAPVAGPAANVREDDFVRFGVGLSHPVALTQDVQGSVSVFYNYNETDSSLNFIDFDQHITGIRFGFLY